jgi:hypothetical protein
MTTFIPRRPARRPTRRLVSLSLLAGLALAATLPHCFADHPSQTAETRPVAT